DDSRADEHHGIPAPNRSLRRLISEQTHFGVRRVTPYVYDVTGCPPWDALELAEQARIVPSFHDGKAVGFKLYAIRPSSAFAQVAIRNGDVLKGLNGVELTSPDKALECYDHFMRSDRLFFELERRDEPVTITVRLERPLAECNAFVYEQ